MTYEKQRLAACRRDFGITNKMAMLPSRFMQYSYPEKFLPLWISI